MGEIKLAHDSRTATTPHEENRQRQGRLTMWVPATYIDKDTNSHTAFVTNAAINPLPTPTLAGVAMIDDNTRRRFHVNATTGPTRAQRRDAAKGTALQAAITGTMTVTEAGDGSHTIDIGGQTWDQVAAAALA